MATAAKSRRPVMMTPPPKARSGPSTKTYTIEEKQQLLDNFDLEVEERVRNFQAQLALTLQSFELRQNTELFRVPRELRGMTIQQVREAWGGTLGGTVARMKQEQLQAQERERIAQEEEERRVREQEVKNKRKLEEENQSPGRSKNARKDGQTGKTTGNGKRKLLSAKKSKSAPTRSSSNQPSSLPQNHIFNPLLPPTPKMPRAPRRGESFLSVNGSPLAHEDDKAHSSEESDDDELPDTEAYEARLAKSTSKPKPKRLGNVNGKGGPSKRAPSFMFRQSLAPNAQLPPSERGEGEGLASIPLKDGRVLSFDPLNMSPGRVEAEMQESGLGREDKELVKQRIRDEVVKALAERMDRWSGMG